MLNKAILVGRLVADPELRQTPQGIPVATFRIAIDRPYSKGGERKTDFLTIVAWRSQAEFVSKYFHKGSDIGIDGSIQTREYNDKEGNKRYAFEIVASAVSFVGRKGGNDSMPMQPASPAAPASSGVTYSSGSTGDFAVVEDDDDLPF